MTPVRRTSESLVATRRLLVVLAVLPVCLASTALFLSIWPWRPVVAHLIVLALLGMILVELCLHGLQKIPFTCSHRSGKSQAHMALWGFVSLMFLMNRGAEFERQALQDPATYRGMLLILCLAAIWARWRTEARAKSAKAELHFEELPPINIFALDLHRDGVMETAHTLLK